ncbi:unnamed protein product, partial [Choristocarpus tenellus]
MVSYTLPISPRGKGCANAEDLDEGKGETTSRLTDAKRNSCKLPPISSQTGIAEPYNIKISAPIGHLEHMEQEHDPQITFKSSGNAALAVTSLLSLRRTSTVITSDHLRAFVPDILLTMERNSHTHCCTARRS